MTQTHLPSTDESPETSDLDVYHYAITTHGFVGFAAREIGKTTAPGNYINNTALYYAFGFADGSYVDTTTQPTYISDTNEIADVVYMTPGVAVQSELETLTTRRNPTSDTYATPNYSSENDPKANKNIPNDIHERRYTPEVRVEGFTIINESLLGELEWPSYIRLGKKRAKAKVTVTPCDFTAGTGEYTTSHPIGLHDTTHDSTGTIDVLQMLPVPLILKASYKGPHLAVSLPDEALISPHGADDGVVTLPSDATFLQEKR